MFGTAVRQLRYGFALLSGGRIRTADMRKLVADTLASRAEFGTVDADEMRALQGQVDPDTRRTVDERRWARAVRRAYTETGYYRERLDGLGLTPSALPLAEAHRLPPTPKSAIRALPEAFVSHRATPVFQAWTTGTTGAPTSVWFSDYELELAASLSAMSFLLTTDIGPADVLQIAISSRAVLALQTTLSAARMLGCAAFLTGLVDPAETLDRLATPVHLPGKKPRVSVLTVAASYLAALVAAAERLGYRPEHFGLESIFCGGEILSDALAARAAEAFGARVVDTYGMTETFPVAGLVCAERHLHITPEQGLVELLRPDDHRPAAPGEVGTLVVTPFFPYRDTTLLLRVATGDLVHRLPEQPTTCEYAAMPAYSRLLGRPLGDGRADGRPPLYQRDVLDLLEGERGVPLPARYAVEPASDGWALHVAVDRDEAAVTGRLESAIAERDLPVRKLLAHADPSSMPRPTFYRALLHETSVAREGDGWTLR